MASLVTVPETSMHENHLFALAENQIRRAWQIAPVQSVSVAHAMYEAPHGHFGTGAVASNKRHSFAAFLWREGIGHQWTIMWDRCLVTRRITTRLGVGNIPFDCFAFFVALSEETRVRGDLSLLVSLVWKLAQILDQTRPAPRLAGRTHVARVQDQPVACVCQKRFGDPPHQPVLDLPHVLAPAPAGFCWRHGRCGCPPPWSAGRRRSSIP